MKTAPQFMPVLKQMLGFNYFGPWPLIVWLGITTATLFFSAPALPLEWTLEGTTQDYFYGAQIIWIGMLWFFLMLVATPLPFQALRGLMSLEFLFTRAIDRGLWPRTERAAVMVIALGPLVLNLALSPWEAKLTFDAAWYESRPQARLDRYENAFPGSHLVAADNPDRVVRHGTQMFAAWLVWAGTLVIFSAAGYFTLIFRAWQQGGWHHSRSRWRPFLGALMVNAPILVIICPWLILICARRQLNVYEESFLLFSSHPLIMTAALAAIVVAVQALSERNIKKLEFEFF